MASRVSSFEGNIITNVIYVQCLACTVSLKSEGVSSSLHADRPVFLWGRTTRRSLLLLLVCAVTDACDLLSQSFLVPQKFPLHRGPRFKV